MPNKNRTQFFHRKGNESNCWKISKFAYFHRSFSSRPYSPFNRDMFSVLNSGLRVPLATEKNGRQSVYTPIVCKAAVDFRFHYLFTFKRNVKSPMPVMLATLAATFRQTLCLRVIVVVVSKFSSFSFAFKMKLSLHMISLSCWPRAAIVHTVPKRKQIYVKYSPQLQ